MTHKGLTVLVAGDSGAYDIGLVLAETIERERLNVQVVSPASIMLKNYYENMPPINPILLESNWSRNKQAGSNMTPKKKKRRKNKRQRNR